MACIRRESQARRHSDGSVAGGGSSHSHDLGKAGCGGSGGGGGGGGADSRAKYSKQLAEMGIVVSAPRNELFGCFFVVV